MKMKKFISVIFALLIIAESIAGAFAETYVIDPVTGEVLSSDDPNSGVKATSVKVNSNLSYDLTEQEFIYSIGESKNDTVSCNVCDGEYTTDEVTITANNGEKIVVYKDGEKVLEGFDFAVTDPGAYVARLDSNNSIILSFSIIGTYISELYSIELPKIYTLSTMKIDGKTVYIPDLGKIDLKTEGEYDVSVINLCDNSVMYLHFIVDHTAPVLEITGLTDGEAHNAVVFGDTEQGSTLEVMLDGEQISAKTQYTDAGDYYVKYTDAAGNVSEYSFRIHMYLDVNTWIYIAVIAAIFIAAGVFMIIKRRSLRVA